MGKGKKTVWPLRDFDPKYFVPSHVDVRLNQDQANTLRRLQAGLMHEGAMLKSGRPVTSAGDAVRYVLEKLRDQ